MRPSTDGSVPRRMAWRGVVCAISLLLVSPSDYGFSQGLSRTIDKLPSQPGCEGGTASLDVAATRMTFDSKTRTFMFEDKVRVQRCTMTILCDRLQVIQDTSQQNIDRIIATGNVQIQQGHRSAAAERAEYSEAQQRVVLTGNPRVWDTQERDELRGEEIVLLLHEEKVLVKQAHVLFHPRKTPQKPPQ